MIPSLEGTNNILDGSYENRPNAVAKCVLVARKNGFQMFDIRDDGLCGGSLTATEKFIFIDIYGNSNDCYIDDRRGINMIYFFEGS